MKFSRREALVAIGVVGSGIALKNAAESYEQSKRLLDSGLQMLREVEASRKSIRDSVPFPNPHDVNLAARMIMETGHPDACRSDFVLKVRPDIGPACEIIAKQSQASETLTQKLDDAHIKQRENEYNEVLGESNLDLMKATVLAATGVIGIVGSSSQSHTLRRAITLCWEKLPIAKKSQSEVEV